MSRLQLGFAGMLLVGATACSGGAEVPPEPPPMSVINQSNGVHTEIEADSWCVDGLFGETCAAVDRSLTEVLSGCDDQFVVAPPDGFTPQPVNTLTKLPEEMGRVWFVEIREGTIAQKARADGTEHPGPSNLSDQTGDAEVGDASRLASARSADPGWS